MNLFDYALIAIVGLSMALSLWRGFVREIISLIGLVAAFLVASRASGGVGDFLGEWIANETAADIAGFGLAFVTVMVLVGLVGALIRKLIDMADLTATDRTLGMLFGATRGVLLIALGFLIYTSFADERQPWIEESQLAPHAIELADVLGRAIPEDLPLSRREQSLLSRLKGEPAEAETPIPERDRKALESIIEDSMQ